MRGSASTIGYFLWGLLAFKASLFVNRPSLPSPNVTNIGAIVLKKLRPVMFTKNIVRRSMEARNSILLLILTFVTASTFSPLCSRVLMTDTWPFMAAVWMPRAPSCKSQISSFKFWTSSFSWSNGPEYFYVRYRFWKSRVICTGAVNHLHSMNGEMNLLISLCGLEQLENCSPGLSLEVTLDWW